MAKSYIHIRVEEDVKQTIEDAAQRKGQTLTTFVVEAAMAAAGRVPAEPNRTRVKNRGVPNYFKACCQEASRGGEMGYRHPAYHLSIHLYDEIPWDAEKTSWYREIQGLLELLHQKDDEGIWNWFVQNYPACMKLVPRRRWQQFVEGVYLAYEQERIS